MRPAKPSFTIEHTHWFYSLLYYLRSYDTVTTTGNCECPTYSNYWMWYQYEALSSLVVEVPVLWCDPVGIWTVATTSPLATACGKQHHLKNSEHILTNSHPHAQTHTLAGVKFALSWSWKKGMMLSLRWIDAAMHSQAWVNWKIVSGWALRNAVFQFLDDSSKASEGQAKWLETICTAVHWEPPCGTGEKSVPWGRAAGRGGLGHLQDQQDCCIQCNKVSEAIKEVHWSFPALSLLLPWQLGNDHWMDKSQVTWLNPTVGIWSKARQTDPQLVLQSQSEMLAQTVGDSVTWKMNAFQWICRHLQKHKQLQVSNWIFCDPEKGMTLSLCNEVTQPCIVPRDEQAKKSSHDEHWNPVFDFLMTLAKFQEEKTNRFRAILCDCKTPQLWHDCKTWHTWRTGHHDWFQWQKCFCGKLPKWTCNHLQCPLKALCCAAQRISVNIVHLKRVQMKSKRLMMLNEKRWVQMKSQSVWPVWSPKNGSHHLLLSSKTRSCLMAHSVSWGEKLRMSNFSPMENPVMQGCTQHPKPASKCQGQGRMIVQGQGTQKGQPFRLGAAHIFKSKVGWNGQIHTQLQGIKWDMQKATPHIKNPRSTVEVGRFHSCNSSGFECGSLLHRIKSCLKGLCVQQHWMWGNWSCILIKQIHAERNINDKNWGKQKSAKIVQLVFIDMMFIQSQHWIFCALHWSTAGADCLCVATVQCSKLLLSGNNCFFFFHGWCAIDCFRTLWMHLSEWPSVSEMIWMFWRIENWMWKFQWRLTFMEFNNWRERIIVCVMSWIGSFDQCSPCTCLDWNNQVDLPWIPTWTLQKPLCAHQAVMTALKWQHAVLASQWKCNVMLCSLGNENTLQCCVHWTVTRNTSQIMEVTMEDNDKSGVLKKCCSFKMIDTDAKDRWEKREQQKQTKQGWSRSERHNCWIRCQCALSWCKKPMNFHNGTTKNIAEHVGHTCNKDMCKMVMHSSVTKCTIAKHQKELSHCCNNAQNVIKSKAKVLTGNHGRVQLEHEEWNMINGRTQWLGRPGQCHRVTEVDQETTVLDNRSEAQLLGNDHWNALNDPCQAGWQQVFGKPLQTNEDLSRCCQESMEKHMSCKDGQGWCRLHDTRKEGQGNRWMPKQVPSVCVFDWSK